MNRSNGRIRPLGLWDALAVASMTAALWFLLWAFVGIAGEFHHYITTLN